ncbi:hypothetical protein NA78x_001788 [Anatilimnocola sp. NA78]|uniref:hypothetical protein n=1 Tax=Anatilimnocola sp. NA78 TaxID=3415683 RepID=UPI003CE4B378
MAHEKNTKLKKPLSVAEIQAMEDKVSEMANVFRLMRARMGEKKVETVELKPGTFLHYLALAQAALMDFPSELEKQVFLREAKLQRDTQRSSAQATREQIKSRRAKERQ